MPGPIEFLSDNPAHDVPYTEFGGDDGLIQPEQPLVLRGDPDASGGHVLSGDDRQMVSERAGIMARAAGVPLVGVEQTTGVSLTGDEVVDPVTGRALPAMGVKNASGEPGELSDLKPGQ